MVGWAGGGALGVPGGAVALLAGEERKDLEREGAALSARRETLWIMGGWWGVGVE